MAKKAAAAGASVRVFERGSLWRRWDPHIHSPESALENNFGTWDEYIDALEANRGDVAVIGITDYCNIDGYAKVLEYVEKGRLADFELIFPNIEFRTTPETSDGSAINIHLLIDPKDPEHLKEIERALTHLRFHYDGTEYGCNRADLIKLGRAHNSKQTDDDGAYKHGVNLFKPEFSEFKRWYESQAWLRKNSLVVISNGKDGPGGLSGDAGFAGVREELYRLANLVFSGNPIDREYFLGLKSDSPDEVIRKYGSLKPCIHGSDAHDMAKLFQPAKDRYCWIKADPTFEGLRQLLHEPAERVYIGPTAPTGIDDSKIIDSVEFVGAADWFAKDTLPLNAGLIGVIGEKGSGKTAFAELVAYAAGSWNDGAGSSSFIKKAKPHLKKVQVKLHWRDGHESLGTFDASQPGKTPEVRYLSQDFVEELCSEDLSGRHLITRIEDVVFTHIEEADRLDAPSFAELKQLKTENLITERATVKASMARLNSEIITIEDQIASRPDKVKQIKKHTDDIAAIDKQLPTLQGSVNAKIDAELNKLSKLLKEKNEELAGINRASRLLQVVKGEATTYVEDTETAFDELKERLKEAGLSAAEIAAFEPRFTGDRAKPFERIAGEYVKTAEKLRGDAKKPDAKGETIADLNHRISELQKSLATDEKQRERLLTLQKQRTKAVADKERLEKEVEKIDGPMTATLEKKRATRMKTYLSYFKTLDEEEGTLQELYAPLEQVIAEDPTGAKAGFELNVKQVVHDEEWLKAGKTLFDGRKKVSALEDGKDKFVAPLFEAWRKRDATAISNALQGLIDELGKQPAGIDGSLNAHANREKVYGWLFDTDHTKLEYSLRYEGTELHVLSPGARGIVLLVLYLSMDTFDNRPLIIDQPEGNLDSASIYKSLVPFLRQAKKTRQVMLVTHNANLVVTTDADQVIVARAERKEGSEHPKITYSAGSLENSGTAETIREQTVKLLEGGPEPFKKRGDRYAL